MTIQTRSSKRAVQPSPRLPLVWENAPQPHPKHSSVGPEASLLGIAHQMSDSGDPVRALPNWARIPKALGWATVTSPVGSRARFVNSPVTAYYPPSVPRLLWPGQKPTAKQEIGLRLRTFLIRAIKTHSPDPLLPKQQTDGIPHNLHACPSFRSQAAIRPA